MFMQRLIWYSDIMFMQRYNIKNVYGIMFLIKPNQAINVLHNLQSHSIGCALNSFLNDAND